MKVFALRRLSGPFVLLGCALLGIVGGFTTLASVQRTAATSPLPSYKLLPGHAMLTKQEQQRLRAHDGEGGSIPFGGKMIYGGGSVLTHPKVYLTFWHWDSDPAGVEPYLKRFFAGVGGSDWISSQNQYCQNVSASGTSCAGGDPITSPRNQLAGVWDDHKDGIPKNPLAEPTTGNSPPLTDEVLRSVAHFGYDPQALYMIETPHGTSTAGFAANGGTVAYCAWHTALILADGSRVAFANIPYIPDGGGSCGQNFVNAGPEGVLDGVSIVAGHEYGEAITDPDNGINPLPGGGLTAPGWYDPDPAAAETGDKCAWPYQQQVVGSLGLPGEAADISLPTGKFAVQSLWSNDANDYAGGCVITDNPPPVPLPSVPTIPGLAAVNSSPSTCHGAEINDPSGDALDPYVGLNVASTDQPSLDILHVQFSTPRPDTLEIKTTVNDLQTFPQGNTLAGGWNVYWNYGGQTYVASVSSDASGLMYADGVHTSAPTSTPAATFFGDSDNFNNTNDTGSFNPGPNGSVVIDVPLSHVGSPPSGAELTKTWAVSFGSVANAFNGSLPVLPVAGNSPFTFVSDQAPDDNPWTLGPYTGWSYKIGSETDCATPRKLPAPPAAPVMPPTVPTPPVPTVNSCTPAWTDAAGDDEVPPSGAAGQLAGVDVSVPGVTTGQNPQLDLRYGYFKVTPDAKTLQVRMVVTNLSTNVPPGAIGEAWNAYFDVNGSQWVASASLDIFGAITYSYWTGGLTATHNTTTGTLSMGPMGVVEIDVPLAGVGNPKLGSLVDQTGARSLALYGTPSETPVEGAQTLTIDVDDAAETKFPNFDGLAFLLSTAPCSPPIHIFRPRSFYQGPPAAATQLSVGGTRSGSDQSGSGPAQSSQPASGGGASAPSSNQPTHKIITPRVVARTTAAPPYWLVLPIVAVVALGAMLAYRRRLG